MKLSWLVPLIFLFSIPLATHNIAPPIIKASVKIEKPAVYKWIDEKGVTHFTDQVNYQKSSIAINVNTKGTSFGSAESRRRELSAVRGFKQQGKRKVSSSYDYQASASPEYPDRFCLRAKQRLSALQQSMKKGYRSEQSNYMRQRKRELSAEVKLACRK